MIDQDKYFDLKGLSEYSSLSVRTLRDYLTDGIDPLPSYCVKKKILVKKSEFDEWVRRYRVKVRKLSDIVEEVINN